MPGEAFGYLHAIERFWLLLRRRGLMVSAEDVQQILRWRAAGVPVRIVCQALVDAASRFRRSRPDDPLPSSLRYFRAAVDEAARGYLGRAAVRLDAGDGAGACAATGAPGPERLLERLVAVGRVEKHEHVREAYRRAYRRLAALAKRWHDGGPGGDVDADPIGKLVAIDVALVDDVVDGMGADERRKLHRDVDAALTEEGDLLGARGLPERRRALLEDVATRRWRLLRLVPAPPDGPRVAGMGWWQSGGAADPRETDGE